jgi:endoglucanase
MELLKKLCFASGVSGFEAEIKEIIAAEIKDYAELKTDAKGNLIAFVKGEKRDKTVCFFAPVDENGFLVNGHTENGEISVTSVGKTEPDSLMGKKLYKSGKTGVINQLPVHLSSKDDKKRLLKEEEITVDFGFESKEEAKNKLCEEKS